LTKVKYWGLAKGEVRLLYSLTWVGCLYHIRYAYGIRSSSMT